MGSTSLSLGGAVSILLVSLPYLVTGQLGLLFASAVLAPLSYARGEVGQSFASVLIHASRFLDLTLVLGLAGAVCAVLSNTLSRPGNRRNAGLCLAAFVGILASVSLGGSSPHYLSLPMPLGAIGLGALVSLVSRRLRPGMEWAACISVIAALVLLVLASDNRRGHEHDVMAETRAFLQAQMAPSDTLYLTTDYGLYWLLGRSPPHPLVTHAGNLFRPFMFRVLPYHISSSAQLMGQILMTRPTWIVFDDEDGPRYFRDRDVAQILNPVLASDYTRVPAPRHRWIFRLKSQGLAHGPT